MYASGVRVPAQTAIVPAVGNRRSVPQLYDHAGGVRIASTEKPEVSPSNTCAN